MPALILSREGFTVGIESPEVADLAWLEENLVPGFQVDTGVPPSRLLTKNVDPRLHRTLLDLGPASPEEHVRCFSFDGHGGECTRWNATAATLYDAELDVFYRLNEDGSRVEVVTASSRPSTSRRWRTASRPPSRGARVMSVSPTIAASTRSGQKTTRCPCSA